MVNKWLKIVQETLAKCLSLPCHCLLCLESSGRDMALCQRCEGHLPWIPHPCVYCALPMISSGSAQQICGECLYQAPVYEYLQALFDYQWPVRQFVSKLKFGGQLHFAKMLGSLMSQKLKPLTAVDCMVAVPLHPKRQKERGFNQALEIAKIISQKQKIPLDKFSCQRVKYTLPQTGLNAKKRATNMRYNYFSVSPKFKARHVLVIEDVVTTGSTVVAFTKALKQAGVETVEVWACCRTGLDEIGCAATRNLSL